MKKLLLLVLAILAIVFYSCMQDMPSESPIGELKITTPFENDKFAIGDTVNIQADVNMIKLDRIDFFVDGVLKGTDKSSPFTCDWLTAGSTVAEHEIKAISYGSNGSITQSIKVDLANGVAPDLSISDPLDNSNYKIGSIINISATAKDIDGNVKSVDFYINDSLILHSTALPYSASWNTAGLPEGNYTLKVIAKDNLGLTSTKQIAVNLFLTLPVCLLEYPANNSVYLYGQMVKIKAKSTENKKSISNVKFYIDNNLVQTSSVSDSGNYYFYNWNTTNETVKNHQLKVTATDHNGVISTSNLVSVILNKAPTVDFINPQNNQVLAISSTVPISVNALDNDGTINNVKIFIDGIEKAVLTTEPYSYSWNTTGLTFGSHNIRSVATDDQGCSAEKVISVTLNHAPSVTITAPTNGSNHLIGSNISILATATDSEKKSSTGKDKSKIKLSAKSKSVLNVKFYINDILKSTDDTSPYEYIWNSTGLAVGSYTIKTVATDNQGSIAEQQILVILHSKPTATITAPLNNTIITIGNTVNITASAMDGKKSKNKSVSKVDFYVDGVLKGSDNSDPYSCSWITTGLSIGIHTIKAIVTDNYNVTGEHQISIDLQPPPVKPTVSTTPISNITINSATSGGNVTNHGGASVTARGVCWSTSGLPIVTGNHTSNGSGTGIYSSNITGLSEGVRYIVRAYATNSVGTGYGDTLSFRIKSLPTVVTSPISSIGAGTAICGGNVTYSGLSAVTARGVCWSTSGLPTVSNFMTTDGSGTGVYTSELTSLVQDTRYIVRAWAYNSAGTSYGDTVSFRTLAPWKKNQDFLGQVRGRTTGFSIGTKGYIGTGYPQDNHPYLKDYWQYDPNTNQWVQKTDFNGVARTCAVGFSIGAKGYIGTGYSEYGNNLKDFWEYNPNTNQWMQKADFGGVGRFWAVGFSIGTKGYIGTGYVGENDRKKDFWEYNPITNQWLQKADFGGVGRHGAVGFSIGSKGYIGTGSAVSEGLCKDFWEYDPNTNQWEQKADFGGSARYYAVGFSIGTKGYIGTGRTESTSLVDNDFWEYDPNANQWEQKTDFGGVARCDAVGFSIGTKGYIGVGNNQSSGYYSDFWEYDPVLDVKNAKIKRKK